jgi:hypothetical protein
MTAQRRQFVEECLWLAAVVLVALAVALAGN